MSAYCVPGILLGTSYALSFNLHVKLVKWRLLFSIADEETLSLVRGSAWVFRSKPDLIPKSYPLIII